MRSRMAARSSATWLDAGDVAKTPVEGMMCEERCCNATGRAWTKEKEGSGQRSSRPASKGWIEMLTQLLYRRACGRW